MKMKLPQMTESPVYEHDIDGDGDGNGNGDIESNLETPPPTPVDAPPAASKQALIDAEFRDTVIDIITPSLVTDVRDMVKGRVLWRRTSTAFEVIGRVTGAAGTIIAFAGSSDITGDVLSRAFAFSAGCLGTTSIVSTLFASFSRQQSLERSEAINTILTSANVKAIPDVAHALDIQGGSRE
jgi:hypothetical protein